MIDIDNFIESQFQLIEESYNNNENPLVLKGMLSVLNKLIDETNRMDKYFKLYISIEEKINTLKASKSA
jgi:hypothetical protein